MKGVLNAALFVPIALPLSTVKTDNLGNKTTNQIWVSYILVFLEIGRKKSNAPWLINVETSFELAAGY